MNTEARTQLQIAPRERLRDKLFTGLRTRHLDVALANGAVAEASPALALRARRLTRFSRRRELAGTIRTLVGETRGDGSRSYLRVRPLPGRVAAASDALTRLAEGLARPQPVSPRGVAQALLLLTDGTGPLYNPRSGGSIGERAVEAAENLALPARR